MNKLITLLSSNISDDEITTYITSKGKIKPYCPILFINNKESEDDDNKE